MPWRLVSRKQQKDSKLGSREVRGPLNKRGSCRTFFFFRRQLPHPWSLGEKRRPTVRVAVRPPYKYTRNTIPRDWTIDRCHRLSVFFYCKYMYDPDVHT
jgi:hypothetical protein